MSRQQPRQPSQEQMQPREVALPEHEKLKALDGANQVVGDFLTWLGETGFQVAARHEHTAACWGYGQRECGYSEGQLAPVHRTVSQWLSAYFEIDENRLEQEKREMLATLRGEEE